MTDVYIKKPVRKTLIEYLREATDTLNEDIIGTTKECHKDSSCICDKFPDYSECLFDTTLDIEEKIGKSVERVLREKTDEQKIDTLSDIYKNLGDVSGYLADKIKEWKNRPEGCRIESVFVNKVKYILLRFTSDIIDYLEKKQIDTSKIEGLTEWYKAWKKDGEDFDKRIGALFSYLLKDEDDDVKDDIDEEDNLNEYDDDEWE